MASETRPRRDRREGMRIWGNPEQPMVTARKDGPSEERDDGVKIWTDARGLLHREDGPAIEGLHNRSYFRNGRRSAKAEWL